MMSGIDGIASWNSVAGFSELHIEAGGVAFCGVTGGSGGPPVLLLHGYPQTHLAWRHVAPRLAQSFTVVAPDLPGYGSSRPDSDRPRWTKRRVASALIALMAKLGHRRFAVVGHDRGHAPDTASRSITRGR
jgi:haloacetate dehalogenase